METTSYILEKWEKLKNHQANNIDIYILAGFFRVSKNKLIGYDKKAVFRVKKKIQKLKINLDLQL